jgi:hypothetical protein
MLKTANIATHPKRAEALNIMLDSIKGQFDKVRVYYNETLVRPKLPEWVEVIYGLDNLTDLGKFYFLSPEAEEIYFTLDDDIVYPPTYVEDTIAALEAYGYNTIVTYHGRKLVEAAKDYYLYNQVFRCLDYEPQNKALDVGGTGVMAFSTKYYNPWYIKYSKERKQSDLTISFDAAENEKQIIGLKHKAGYLNNIVTNTSIYEEKVINQTELIKKANKIYALKYG